MAPRPIFRQELHDFIRACETVLSMEAYSPQSRLTKAEVDIIRYYTDELRQFVDKKDQAAD